jgi:hypothetical protein
LCIHSRRCLDSICDLSIAEADTKSFTRSRQDQQEEKRGEARETFPLDVGLESHPSRLHVENAVLRMIKKNYLFLFTRKAFSGLLFSEKPQINLTMRLQVVR